MSIFLFWNWCFSHLSAAIDIGKISVMDQHVNKLTKCLLRWPFFNLSFESWQSALAYKYSLNYEFWFILISVLVYHLFNQFKRFIYQCLPKAFSDKTAIDVKFSLWTFVKSKKIRNSFLWSFIICILLWYIFFVLWQQRDNTYLFLLGSLLSAQNWLPVALAFFLYG